MIMFSPNLIQVFQNRPIDVFYTLKIWRPGEEVFVRTTTNPWDLSMTDEKGVTETYSADNRLVGLDAPQTNSTVDREEFKIIVADPDFVNGPYVDGALMGAKAEARVGFYLNGTPLTNFIDTILSYAGRVAGCGYLIRAEEAGDSLLEITCSSPMADLDLKKGLFLSKDFVRSRNPDDSSCDQVYGGSSAASLKWGKG